MKYLYRVSMARCAVIQSCSNLWSKSGLLEYLELSGSGEEPAPPLGLVAEHFTMGSLALHRSSSYLLLLSLHEARRQNHKTVIGFALQDGSWPATFVLKRIA
jgi:hypothetical protein